MTLDLKQDTLLSLASNAVYHDRRRTSACVADTSFLSRTPGAPVLRRQDTVRRLLDPTGLLASDLTYPSTPNYCDQEWARDWS